MPKELKEKKIEYRAVPSGIDVLNPQDEAFNQVLSYIKEILKKYEM